FVAGYHTATCFTIIKVLALLVTVTAIGVHPLYQQRRNARFLAKPNWRAYNQNVGCQDFLFNFGPIVFWPAGLSAIFIHAKGNSVVQGINLFHFYTLLAHNAGGAVH